MQEVQTVISERNSLQRQLADLAAVKESEICQLHEEKAKLQVLLPLVIMSGNHSHEEACNISARNM
jgi:predicted XRE-type DNA-binding protein